MNKTTIRKGTIMKKFTLALLGLACLMAMPNIAHARYRDGMHMYQYAQSSPVVRRDASGLSVEADRIADYAAFEKQMDKFFMKNLETEWLKRKRDLWLHSGDKLQMGLHVAGYKVFWPGGKDSGENRFIYTCKCGWIDVGHFLISASIARAVRVDLASGPFSGMIAEDLAYKVGAFVEELQELGRLNTGFDRDGYDAQYAEGMNRIFAGEGGLQGGVWIPEDPRGQDGWSQSAFTVEDLPSDRFGAHFGASSSPLGRIQFWRGPDYWGPRLKEDIKSKFKGFLEGCGAVSLDGPSRKHWGGKLLTAGEVLHGDAQRMQDSIRIQANAGAGYDEFVDGMTMDPKYLYNRSDKSKRTYSHDCVCDGDKPYCR